MIRQSVKPPIVVKVDEAVAWVRMEAFFLVSTTSSLRHAAPPFGVCVQDLGHLQGAAQDLRQSCL